MFGSSPAAAWSLRTFACDSRIVAMRTSGLFASPRLISPSSSLLPKKRHQSEKPASSLP